MCAVLRASAGNSAALILRVLVRSKHLADLHCPMAHRQWQSHRRAQRSERKKRYSTSPRTPTVLNLWTVVRACVLVSVWLKRNMRIFNSSIPGITWAARANQAGQDIKAHVEPAISKCPPDSDAAIKQMIDQLKRNHGEYRRVLTSTLLNR